jgi:hypothetical protein
MATQSWGSIGREIIQQLQGGIDEKALKKLGQATINKIYEREETAEKRDKALKMISREILKKFPRMDVETQNYWHDDRGKADLKRWRHNIFKYLTLDRSDWDAVGDENREQWKAEQQEVKAKTEVASSKAKTKPLTIDQLTIDQYKFDSESQSVVENAIALTGLSLPDFTRQALVVYAKTVVGKTKKQSEDLTTVLTDKLLYDTAYSTHPGRAEELTKRAIKAIKLYNSNIATENADRWYISQSAIVALTRSRPSTVGEVLEQFKDEIESHNQTYELGKYSNRKRGKPSIDQTINMAELVLDGLD